MGTTLIFDDKASQGSRMSSYNLKNLPNNMARKDSELSMQLDEEATQRFLRHVTEEYKLFWGGLFHWRSGMEKWEKMSEGDYSHRIGVPDPNNPESILDTFSYTNETLGMSASFAEFAASQGLDDVFGTKPWLSAAPQGKSDTKLAQDLTKHSQWKLDASNFENAAKDAIRIACWGGTAFLKVRWLSEAETAKRSVTVAFSKSSGEPFKSPRGEFIETAEELEAMGVDGEDVEWKSQLIDKNSLIYDNVRAECLDFRDVAFDSKADELNLRDTSFYSRTRMRMLDVISHYSIPENLHASLRLALVGSDEEARFSRGESNTDIARDDEHSNPMISLVEGFVKYKHSGNGGAVRTHCVFSPELNIMFSANYLINDSPNGDLPVFPVRINKIPRRILGVGYFEKYEGANNSVDRQYCATIYRNQLAANVLGGIHPEMLVNPKDASKPIDSRTPLKLLKEYSLADYIQFAVVPDNNSRSVELMNQQLQMAQMRSGITSAAQGELKGVPESSTATGVNQMMSRGALLLKDPISQMTKDLEGLVGYVVNLIYANQDADETFAWGEGDSLELLDIKSGDVKGLRMNVTLSLVQSQNQTKLQSTQIAISIATGYVNLPENEKNAQRQLYIDALTWLGFNNAADIIRPSVADPQGVLALLPPDVAAVVEGAFASAGLMPQAEAAPVMDDAEI
jgi:hypothetical protein